MLTDIWRDAVSLVSLLLTAFGFGYALWQIHRMRTSVEAARQATEIANDNNRTAIRRFAAANAHRYMSEVKNTFNKKPEGR